jgi:hypothetical protein
MRGRWSCVDGVTVFGWSGSALLGGYLVDRHGFAPVFFVTAAMQFLATLLFTVPLLCLVPQFETGRCEVGMEECGACCAQCVALCAANRGECECTTARVHTRSGSGARHSLEGGVT